MVKKSSGRVYLNDEEKKVLTGLLDEWNSNPNKKTRDAFVSAEALPKIQQLDLSRFGPDVISRNKAAKVLWDSRVQVRFLLRPIAAICSTHSRRFIPGLKTTSLTRTGQSSNWRGKYLSEGLSGS
jgi:hypothetical protein